MKDAIHISKILPTILQILSVIFATGFASNQSLAAAPATSSTATLKQGLATTDEGPSLFGPAKTDGFSFGTNTFSGHANGRLDQPGLDQATDLVGDQRVYALLIDGKYDFKYVNDTPSALHPYVLGGVGMAMFGQPIGTSSSNGMAGDTAPLLRMGGGVAYRLDQKWNMNLDYKAGFIGKTGSSDHIFTGRGQEPVDLHAINMGLKYNF